MQRWGIRSSYSGRSWERASFFSSLLCDTHPTCGLQLSNGIPYTHCEDLNGLKKKKECGLTMIDDSDYGFLLLARAFPLFFFSFSSSSDETSDSNPSLASGSSAPAAEVCPRVAAYRLPLSMTISLSQPFSLLRSAASRSNSSARPVKLDTDLSRVIVLFFFFIRNRAGYT